MQTAAVTDSRLFQTIILKDDKGILKAHHAGRRGVYPHLCWRWYNLRLTGPKGELKGPTRKGALTLFGDDLRASTITPASHSLYSTLKEFFNPLRTGDSRTDFFAIYQKESEEFDRHYTKKYDEDLSTTLIFVSRPFFDLITESEPRGIQAGLFSAVSATFVTNVQPKLEQDPNDVTVVYMQVLIHAMDNTLFPNIDPGSTTWTGPPREIVVVQSLLYASLATSLFAAFLAMLGKQWVNHYLRNHGGSAADKSRDRQRKLDGHEKWRFYLAIECLPVMLQFALFLFACAVSVYLWTISRAVAWIVVVFTLAAATVYAFFTFGATAYYDCPYQTPLSVLIQTLTRYLARYLKHSHSTLARATRYSMVSIDRVYSYSVKKLRRLRSGVRSTLRKFGWILVPPDAQLNAVGQGWYFGENRINWEVCKADARCISWILNFTTDSDVIFYGARFAADTIWYPKIADTLSPHVLSNLFLDCLSYGRVTPGQSEHASVIGMALASALSIQLCIEPGREDLQELSGSIHHYADCVSQSEPTLLPGIGILIIVSKAPYDASFSKWDKSDDLPTTHKLCLSRVILQTVWRWRRIQDAPAVFNLEAIDLLCKGLMANGDHSHPILKIYCLLTLAISLGCQVGEIDMLFISNDEYVISVFFH